MRIVRLETFCNSFVRFVRLTTADGAVGWGQLSIYNTDITAQVFHRQIAPWSLGDDENPVFLYDTLSDHPVNAPEWKTHTGLQYERPVGWGSIFGRADWSWTDEYNTSFSADPRLKQDAYSWVNLRAGTRWDNCELVFWVENATDETVVNLDAVLTLFAIDGSYQSLLQSPRSYGVGFRANF